MSNVLLRRAAPWAHAPIYRLAAPLACAWIVWAPAVPAAEAIPPEQAAFAPFKHYQGWRDEPLLDWRQANNRVGEIGGWRTYLRESEQGGDGADHGGHDHRDHGN